MTITMRTYTRRYLPDAVIDGDITEYTYASDAVLTFDNAALAAKWLNEQYISEPGEGDSTRWFSGRDESYDHATGEIEEVSAHVDDEHFDAVRFYWQATDSHLWDEDDYHALYAYVEEVCGPAAFGSMSPEDVAGAFREAFHGLYDSPGDYCRSLAEETDETYRNLTPKIQQCIDWSAYAKLREVEGMSFALHPETGAGVFVFTE